MQANEAALTYLKITIVITILTKKQGKLITESTLPHRKFKKNRNHSTSVTPCLSPPSQIKPGSLPLKKMQKTKKGFA